MFQSSTKRRTIVIASIVIVVLVISLAASLIAFYHQPSTVKQSPSKLEVTVSLNQPSVIQGSNLQGEVNVTTIGNAENVTLSSDVGSSGINCTFEPSWGTSNFTSTLFMSMPDSTPTGNYTITVTALGVGQEENASCVFSVLSANVTVSGRASVNKMGSIVRQIKFVDETTNATNTFSFPTNPAAYNNNVYSVNLENEHTYYVTIDYFWGNGEIEFPATYYAGDFHVYALAGNNTITLNVGN